MKANKEGTLKIVESINRAVKETPLDKHFLDETFNLWWPKLEEKLSNLPSVDDEHISKSERNEKDLLIEILEIVRNFTMLNSKNQYIILDSKNLFETEVDASGNTILKPLDVIKLYQAYSKMQTKLNDTGDKLSLCQKLFDFDNEKSSKRSDI